MSISPVPGLSNAPRHVRSRTQSISSDRPSTIAHSLMSAPLSVSPEAAFMAASAASQIVTNEHDSQSETWYDQVGIEPSGETALVTHSALQLANNFVDQLLFNIIAVAKSTTLSALRPAVSEVLKPKLAKDAINQADEELREYLGGGEVEDLVHSPSTESSRDWDLELVWKRTRLRCMVYSSLGDMEEEDEDHYMEEEHLSGESDDIMSTLVSPAVAIFLTSILEFMGEQVLVISGQAAFSRMRIKYEKELKEGARSPGELSERIVVEELDMERVALDRTIGRLWRSWKKRIRSPSEPNYSRPFSRSSTGASGFSHGRRGSSVTDLVPSLPTPKDGRSSEDMREEKQSDSRKGTSEKASQDLDPADMPLPDSDVEATYSDEEESEVDDDLRPRPKSWIVSTNADLPVPVVMYPYRSVRRARSLPSRKRPRHITNAVLSQQDASGSNETADETGGVGQNNDSASASDSELGSQAKPPDGLISKIATGAAAVGTAAVTGLTAVATGQALQTAPEEDEDEDLEEVPKIMTSSRISIGSSIGGRSSPVTSEPTRPPSLIQARSNSVRSLRVIDVQGPRSPSIRSRASSIEAQDHSAPARSTNISREGSVSTPPIVEENDPEAPFAQAKKRSAVVSPSPTDDVYGLNAPAAARPMRNRSPPKSVPSPASAQQSAPPPASTKVTILSSSLERHAEERADVPQKPTGNLRNPPMPTLPEKSASRPNYGQSNSSQHGSAESPKLSRHTPSDSPTSSTSAKFKPMRSSEDSNNRPDVPRNFDELIQSNETLQYTLTPENMRYMDTAASPHDGSPKVGHTRSRRSEDVKHAERSRPSSIKRSLSVTRSTGLGSHPPTDFPANGMRAASGPNAPLSVPPKGRTGAVPQARDARIPKESTQDFANFIRSTGPPGANGAHPDRANAGPVSTNVRNTSGHTPATKSGSLDSRRTDLSARARLQARDATVNPSNESSELIDFIRRGPPNANNPRIPRNVAPFRSTMDSDQMQMTGAVGGKAVDAVIPNVRTSQASTNVTETSAPSSMNSQSALLNKANKPAPYSGNNFDEDDMMPKRTRRRVKDPYALDFSDEEDGLDELEMTPKPKPKKEESLIDFLNNYPPPPEPTPQPIMAPKKKSSTPNLLARLRSSATSSSGSNSNLIRRASNASKAEPRASKAEPRASTSQVGGSKGYTPLTIPVGAENFGMNSRAPSAPRAGPTGRVPMKKFEPREAASTNTRTSDLASFLRDSEPPPSTLASLPSPTEEKGSSGFSRMFERRKKSTAY